MVFDSRYDTKAHMAMVESLIAQVMMQLIDRMESHDQSKLEEPEKSIFDEHTPHLRSSVYGSDEYKARLEKMAPALQHHYANNRHHPEHFSNGITGMTLVDLIEMLADWKAASIRHADGDIIKSIEINTERFGISDQLMQILINTVKEMEWTR